MTNNLNGDLNENTVTNEDSLANDAINTSLPEESRMFAYYQPLKTNNKVWDASVANGGTPFHNCERPSLPNALLNYPYSGAVNQQFI